MRVAGGLLAAVVGAFGALILIIPGVLLRWVIQPQLFAHAYVVGDVLLWAALAVILIYALFGVLAGWVADS